MSFFSALKSAFGFGPDPDYISDPETADDPDAAASETSGEECAAAPEAVAGLSEVPTLPEIDPAVKARIFDGAVAVFNEALPDFLRRSVNPDAQSQRLAQALDKGVDDYLNGLLLVAEQYAEAKLKGAAETARRDAEKLRSDMQLIEQQRTNLREQQLSADRRRRALADRVNDLEGQVATLEAEREQFELENRSLLNKLKVADIQPGVVDEMAREIEQLKAALAAAGGAESSTPAESADTSALEEAHAALEAANAELAEAKARMAEAEKELADNRTQQEMSQAMYNDLQSSLAAERDAKQKLEADLAEAHKIVESVAEIQAQMAQVEDVIHKRDERIERLKSSNKKLREQLAEAQENLEKVRNTDDGLFSTARAEVSGPKSDYSAIEDEFECPDWFVSEPAPGEVSPLLHPAAEFGYQEPPKKPRRPENDAQLSLF
ncbi:MAG: hypothetical protein NC418_00490 [Muribaculaceae bacterium]|nr:hypothetical protein [Muribaculaceae bacterium]